eukprot:TRINITY_DN43418_c0_g1_i1.p1 TRINITY_DN43418_c0_g1~~TRINITY_DN43418_c0_g1_i1.p1  ORF type:complete len:511 (+),score=207.19 TRINITY_DN43418_c0_g1_i1:55-1533(+)
MPPADRRPSMDGTRQMSMRSVVSSVPGGRDRRSSSILSTGTVSPANDAARRFAQRSGEKSSFVGKRKAGQGRGTAAQANKLQQKRDDEVKQVMLERAERLEREYEAELFACIEQHKRDRQELLDLRRESEDRRERINVLTAQLAELQQRHDKFQQRTRDFEEEMQKQITRLTIDRHELAEKCAGFDRIRIDLERRNEELVSLVQTLEMRVRDADVVRHGIEHDASVMETNLKRALNTARRDNLTLRMMHTAQEKELRGRLEEVEDDLQNLVNRVEAAVVPVEVRASAAEELNGSLDLLRIRYQDLLQQCRLKVSRFSTELIKVSSLHSNMPDYVKASLEQQSDEQLRRLIDTLAFDEGVRQYLEMLFPPPFETDGFRRPFKCPDTPSAALASGDLFVTGKRRPLSSEELRPQTAPTVVSPGPPPAIVNQQRPQSVPAAVSRPSGPLQPLDQAEAPPQEPLVFDEKGPAPLPPAPSRPPLPSLRVSQPTISIG